MESLSKLCLFDDLLRWSSLDEHHATILDQKLSIQIKDRCHYKSSVLDFLLIPGDLHHELDVVEPTQAGDNRGHAIAHADLAPSVLIAGKRLIRIFRLISVDRHKRFDGRKVPDLCQRMNLENVVRVRRVERLQRLSLLLGGQASVLTPDAPGAGHLNGSTA